jgi:hypothetical protein
MIKKHYEIPESELLLVKFEENIMSLRNGVNYSNTPGGAGGDDVYDDGDEF